MGRPETWNYQDAIDINAWCRKTVSTPKKSNVDKSGDLEGHSTVQLRPV